LSWTIGLEITGSRIDAEGLVRLDEVLRREFPELDAACDLWSGRLGVDATIDASTPTEALESALATLNTAFAWAGIELKEVPEVAGVTMRRRSSDRPAAESDSLPHALVRRISPSRDSVR
jgi:hypothetical protein